MPDPSCHPDARGGVLLADRPNAEIFPLVALVGPPNSGKSTLFNQLTGLRQKVANYPGVTVEKHVGTTRLPDHRALELVDLPGANGFAARSMDERVTRDVLESRVPGLRAPDALMLIVDSTRLEAQLMLGIPTLLVPNMADELEQRGGAVRDDVLAERLGVEVVRTSARAGDGLDQVRDFLIGVADRGLLPPRPCPALSNVVTGTPLPMVDQFTERRRRIQEIGRVSGFVLPRRSRLTERLDGLFLHRVWGPLIFLAVVVLVFQSIFTWAVPLMNGVQILVAGSGAWVAELLPESWLRALLIDGVWAGVGSVVVFLPQILVLFLFLGLLEDSGYMARAAVIADRMMY